MAILESSMLVSQTAQSTPPALSIVGGIVITIGTAIGAGMFSLPVIASGMWFGWSLVALLLSWFVLFNTAQMILEVNMNFRPGESFDTMVRATLGRGWNAFNGLLLAFLFYILDYAYISGGGSIVNQTLQATIGIAPPQALSGFIFSAASAFVVWFSTKAVDRVTTILIAGMLVTFIMATFDLILAVNLDNLITGGSSQTLDNRFWYIFSALPYFLTSFGYYGNVPSLVKYYGYQPHTIARAMLIGSVFIFAIYVLWLICVFGHLPQSAFLPIIAQGGNIGVLVGAMNNVVYADGLGKLLSVFANMAIVSSFLGVSMALFDFVADKFKFDDSGIGRLKTALVVFVPPTIGGVIFPNGFIAAIGFAGLVCAVNALVIPPMMFKKSRKLYGSLDSGYSGGSIALANLLIVLGIVFVLCNILKLLNLLPTFGSH